MSDKIIFILLYLATLALLIFSIDFAAPIASDSFEEYKQYIYSFNTGGITLRNDALVVSSLLTTYLPAHIARIFSTESNLLFRIFPQFLYALAPMFVYGISRRYCNKRYALLAAAFLVCNVYFLYWSELGRVGVGFAMFAGVIYGLVSGRRWVAILFSGLLPFAHYGSYFLLDIILVATFAVLLAKRDWKEVKFLLVPLSVLLIVGMAWHAGFVRSSYIISTSAITRTVDITSMLNNEANLKPVINNIAPTETENIGFWNLESRGVVVQAAFGKTWPDLNSPQRIELIITWIVVLTLAAGVIYALRCRLLSGPHLIMAGIAILIFIMALIMPAASKLYGIARFYTPAVIILAPCFAIFAKRIMPYFPMVLLFVYALLLTGIVHSWFGIVK